MRYQVRGADTLQLGVSSSLLIMFFACFRITKRQVKVNDKSNEGSGYRSSESSSEGHVEAQSLGIMPET